MNLIQGVITRKEARKISSDYVAFVEGNFDKYDSVSEVFSTLRKGAKVITYSDGQYVKAKVTSINNDDFRAVDGPVVRVSNGEYSWRVDGDKYAWPIA